MKQAPTLSAIDAVELRMEESRRETLAALRRAEAAIRDSVARPSTIAAVAGVAGVVGLAGFLLARRPRRRRRAAYATGTGVVVASSLAAIVRFLLSRYGVRGLTLVVRQLRRARAKRGGGGGAEVPPYATSRSP